MVKSNKIHKYNNIIICACIILFKNYNNCIKISILPTHSRGYMFIHFSWLRATNKPCNKSIMILAKVYLFFSCFPFIRLPIPSCVASHGVCEASVLVAPLNVKLLCIQHGRLQLLNFRFVKMCYDLVLLYFSVGSHL